MTEFPERAGARTWLAGLLAAGTYAAGMPGYDVPGVTFVCMAPFLDLSVRAGSARRAAWRGWIAGTAGSAPLYYWIAYTISVEGKLGWPLGTLAAFLVSAYLGAWFSVAAAAAYRLEARFGARGLWGFPLVWTGLELARTHLFSGFPWMLLGYALAGDGVLRQAADLAGVYGLSFLLVLCGTSLYLAGRRLAERAPAWALLRLAPGAAAILFLHYYGLSALPAAGGQDNGVPSLKVGIAQGGIDQSVKWEPWNQQRTLDTYDILTRKARKAGAQVVIWPETAAPFFYGWEQEYTRRVEGIAATAGVPLIFGAPWFDPGDGGRFYNSVFHLDARGTPVGRYDKRHLVPFGEYIPMRRILFFLEKLTEGAEDFSRGTSPSLFRVSGYAVAATVCYEAIFPGIPREAVLEGASWLVNVTNDAWFGNTVAPYQHLAMARMRCVELRRPMARAANSGISAVIDPEGGIVASEGLYRRGIVVAEIRPGTGRTFYAKTGEIFGISCIIIAFLILFFPLRGVYGFRLPGRKDRGA
ncbi:MAG: apolipoprotein N-acyltransferase [Thermodesulfobacteriota bacterium]